MVRIVTLVQLTVIAKQRVILASNIVVVMEEFAKAIGVTMMLIPVRKSHRNPIAVGI